MDTSTRLLQEVRLLVAELHGQGSGSPGVALDSVLDRDLGIDSLGRLELLSRIERALEVGLAEQQVVEAETVRDLLRVVHGAAEAVSRSAGPVPAGNDAQAQPSTPRGAGTLIEVLDWHARHHPERVHASFYADEGDGETLSYAQLREGARVVARGLQMQGVAPGETVAMMLPTGREYFFGFFGILLAGAIPVPIYPPARRAQLEDHIRRQANILRNCQARALITVPEARQVAGLLRALVETLRASVTVEELAAARGDLDAPPVASTDIAFLQYTSGSTGSPKGVILTHANLLANIRADGAAIQAGPADVFVSWLPLYHDMGLIGAWLGALYHATRLVIMSPLSFLARPQRWLWAIHRYRGTLSAAPNFAYELCLNRIQDQELRGLDLSRWRLTFNGAEAVSPETLRRFSERFAPYGLRREAMFPVYGLAECSLGLTFPPLGRIPRVDAIERETFMRCGEARPAASDADDALRFVSCGRPLPGHALRIVDAGGAELPERHEGRVQFQGPSATSGYYRNPEATRALFRGDWLEPGDLGYSAGGEVYITGRTRDIVIRAGRNIYPHELEETLGELPGVRTGRVVVFGSREARSGTERLVVIAETRERSEEARTELRRRIGTITVDLTGVPPDEVVLAPPGTVLKTSSGKLRRSACRELYERGLVGAPRRALWRQLVGLGLAGLPAQLARLRRGLGARLYAGYAWGVYALVATGVWLGVVLLPRPGWRWALMHGAARLLAGLTRTRLVVSGLEHLPPAGRPCVVVANHGSYLDPYVLIAVLTRPAGFVAKAELARGWLGRVFLERIGTALVDRFDRRRGIEDARRAGAALARGRALAFFPEGTFRHTPGLLPFHMGAFVVAAESGVPVVPVAIRGTRAILPPGSWLPRRGVIRVTIGAPLSTPEGAASGGAVWAAALGLRAGAREHIHRHCGEPDLGAPDGGPSDEA